jgi:hypothetical protein
MSSRVAIFFALVTAVGVASYFVLRTTDAADPVAAPALRSAPPSSQPPPPAPVSSLQSAPAPTRSPADPEGMIRYPDGSFMPTLNGVKRPAGIQWPSEVPFSPIIGKQTAAGVEWYVHADGTQTTTQMVWRSDVQQDVAVTHVARPMPALPVEGSDEPTKR